MIIYSANQKPQPTLTVEEHAREWQCRNFEDHRKLYAGRIKPQEPVEFDDEDCVWNEMNS